MPVVVVDGCAPQVIDDEDHEEVMRFATVAGPEVEQVAEQESAVRSDSTSIFRCRIRAVSMADATESATDCADEAADLASDTVVALSVVPEPAAKAAPVPNDTSAVSAVGAAATARAVRLSRTTPRGDSRRHGLCLITMPPPNR
ncbi:hypothetical protein GCM10010129_67940 [Streptomyces fumigatiscleroticus]|nr:hypothetical protein GCM10010129_67940 [Streptomyces fumigatiscleroticus]